MNKLSFLIATFAGLLTSVVTGGAAAFGETQTNAYSFESEIVPRPNDLAPAQRATNENGDTVFLKDYYAPYYFKNLKGRYGNNVKKTCSYVAAEMLLSYYDSFWNDNFLPEKYDGDNVILTDTVLNAVDSPGSKNEEDEFLTVSGLSDEEYYNLVSEHKDDTLHLELISIGIEQLGLYNSRAKKLTMGTFLKDMKTIVQTYLDRSTTLSSDSVDFVYFEQNDLSSEKMREVIIDKVTQGIPVIVDAKNESTYRAHSFIAYDYDEENDEIYCHAGWYDSSRYHISMSELGYTTIQEILYIEPKGEHQHCFNYSRYDESGNLASVCACSSMIPRNIEVVNDYLDWFPTFRWDSLIKDKWSEGNDFHHKLSVLDANRNVSFTIDGIHDNQCTMSAEQWATVINDVAKPRYYVDVGVCSETYPYLDDYSCTQQFTEPNRYGLKVSFLPKDWGFAGRYYFSNELDEGHLSSEPERKNTAITQGGLTIETERLRCGYIEESYVVLSPRRKNAGRAYFELNFDKAVYSFMYRACMWSASESLDGTAKIQTKDTLGTWSELKEIPIESLKTKENGLTQFSEQFVLGIHGLRFEVTSTATGDRNKGRLCLGDMAFSTSLATAMIPYVDYDYAI